MKIHIQHSHIRSTDELDSLVENRIMALQSKLVIEEATVRLERRHEASPPFRVSVHLVTPGPDVFADGCDHTLRAAIAKAMGGLEAQISSRAQKRLRRIRSNLQAPARLRMRG
ncbi:MAG: HPF/RaiA family ribosome-associated protein [Verrucomicrobiae bacterium]|nr:HPF/RaiA family ribosome-associated protein [Verrucomicrobiae bacterium]